MLYKKCDTCSKCSFFTVNCFVDECNHNYRHQQIVDRDGKIYAVEILSRPKIKVNSIEKYFNRITFEDAKKLLFHQLINIESNIKNLNFKTKKVFLNVDRYLLTDDNVVLTLKNYSCRIKNYGWEFIFEITERHSYLDDSIKFNFYRMIVDDVNFAADDYSSIRKTHSFINDYKYVKFDMDDIKNSIKVDFNKFVDDIYLLKDFNIKVIAEKVETENDILICKSIPFDYFQGFYIDKVFYQSNF